MAVPEASPVVTITIKVVRARSQNEPKPSPPETGPSAAFLS